MRVACVHAQCLAPACLVPGKQLKLEESPVPALWSRCCQFRLSQPSRRRMGLRCAKLFCLGVLHREGGGAGETSAGAQWGCVLASGAAPLLRPQLLRGRHFVSQLHLPVVKSLPYRLCSSLSTPCRMWAYGGGSDLFPDPS